MARQGRCGRTLYLDLRSGVLYWHCAVHPAKAYRASLPAARALRAPAMGLDKMIAATAAGKTLDWQADAYGDYRVVEVTHWSLDQSPELVEQRLARYR